MSEAVLATDDTLAGSVLDVLLRGAEQPDPTADRGKEKLLEVAQVFGDAVVDLKHFAAGRGVSLGATLVKRLGGTHMMEDFFVPTALLPGPTHALFQPEGNGWVAVVSPEWDGFVEGPAGRRSLPALAALVAPGPDGLHRVPIGPDDRAVVQVGTTTFVAHPVFPSKKVVAVVGDSIDYPLLGIVGFMGFVAVMLGVALSVIPSPPKASKMGDEDRLAILDLMPPMDIPVPTKNNAEAGAKAKGPEGKVGERDAKMKVAKGELTRKPSDADIAKEAGVLGALANNAVLDSMLNDSTLSGAINDGVGGLIGAKGTQIGAGGLAARGGGFGGGGTAEGLGGLGLFGKGRGATCQPPGCDYDGLSGITRTPGREPGSIQMDDGGIILGALDRSQIDAVIKRHLNQIRYCYQRELSKNPSLSGKVNVKFVIAKDGSVSSATTKTSTLANAAAESCINSRFMRFQFPEPKGGGIVVVSYPFLFAPS